MQTRGMAAAIARASPGSTASTSATTRAWTACCWRWTAWRWAGLAGPRSAAYLALMTSYGVAVAVQDAWNEQLVKRGLVARRLPPVHRPAVNRGWAAIAVGSLVTYRLFTRQ